MYALNLMCPEGGMGDWHQAGWLMGGTAEIGPWAAWEVLGNDGVHDGRRALRALFAKVVIGPWCWGGHPAGRRKEPVWVASHARAIIDMMGEHLAKSECSDRRVLPHPTEACLWTGSEQSRNRMLEMALRMKQATSGQRRRVWEDWIAFAQDLEGKQRRGENWRFAKW